MEKGDQLRKRFNSKIKNEKLKFMPNFGPLKRREKRKCPSEDKNTKMVLSMSEVFCPIWDRYDCCSSEDEDEKSLSDASLMTLGSSSVISAKKNKNAPEDIIDGEKINKEEKGQMETEEDKAELETDREFDAETKSGAESQDEVEYFYNSAEEDDDYDDYDYYNDEDFDDDDEDDDNGGETQSSNKKA